jgi:hypothetical protein
MNTVVAQVYQGIELLKEGFPAGTQRRLLYAGPARLSMPARAWQRTAALEGIYSGTLHVLSAADLTKADEVAVGEQVWKVLGHSNSANQWRLDLSVREVSHA